MKLSPDETRSLLGACGVALDTLRGLPTQATHRDALLTNGLGTFVSLCRKLRTEVRENEMGKPRADKSYLHVALTTEAKDALHDHLLRAGNGSIRNGAISEFLSELILAHCIKPDTAYKSVSWESVPSWQHEAAKEIE
jgi:hypothetical protein